LVAFRRFCHLGPSQASRNKLTAFVVVDPTSARRRSSPGGLNYSPAGEPPQRGNHSRPREALLMIAPFTGKTSTKEGSLLSLAGLMAMMQDYSPGLARFQPSPALVVSAFFPLPFLARVALFSAPRYRWSCITASGKGV